jgi:hypothetical protein
MPQPVPLFLQEIAIKLLAFFLLQKDFLSFNHTHYTALNSAIAIAYLFHAQAKI